MRERAIKVTIDMSPKYGATDRNLVEEKSKDISEIEKQIEALEIHEFLQYGVLRTDSYRSVSQ